MVREGYKETEIGEIPVEWEVKSFSEACGRLLNGGTPNTQVPKYWDGSIPWITGADVVNQKIENIRRYITEKAVEDSSTSVIPKECLLVVTRTGVGKLAITPFDVAVSQDITGVIPKTDYDIEYLFWVLNASRNYFQNLTQGTSINGITRNDLTQFKFAVPPLPEQRRIAAVLSTIDEAIEKTEALIAKLRQVKAGLMQDLLTKGIDEEGRVRSEETHAFKDSEIGRVPVEWEVALLNDLLEQTSQIIPERTPNRIFKYIDVSSISRDALQISSFQEFKGKFAPSRARRLIKKDDIIFSTVRPYLKQISLVPEVFNGELCSTAFCVSRCDKSKLFYHFCFYYLTQDGFIRRVSRYESGSNYPAVLDKHIQNQVFPLPPLPEQHRIAAVLTAADDRIAREEAYRDKLLAVKEGLMADLLAGRVRVPEGVAE
jgi:type I restriction enzyme S subunit